MRINFDGRVMRSTIAAALILGAMAFPHSARTAEATLAAPSSAPYSDPWAGSELQRLVEFSRNQRENLSISADGNTVVFSSDSDDLVDEDNNGVRDVFAVTVATGRLERVSVDSGGAEASDWSSTSAAQGSSVSADGRFVVFESVARNLVPQSVPGHESQTYLRDRHTQTTELISVNSVGDAADSQTFPTDISDDGRFVILNSWATNLDSRNDDTGADVYLLDRQTGEIEWVSYPAPGYGVEEAQAFEGMVSEDGRYVSFTSPSQAMKPDVEISSWSAFVRDRHTGEIEVANPTSDGSPQVGGSVSNVHMSGNGEHLIYDGIGDYISGDPETDNGLFVFSRATQELEQILVPAELAFRGPHSISDDGRFVSFVARGDILPNPPVDQDRSFHVYVMDRLTGFTSRASTTSTGVTEPGHYPNSQLSPDGSSIVFYSDTPLTIDGIDGEIALYIRTRSAPNTCGESNHSDGIVIVAPEDCAIIEGADTGVAPLDLKASTDAGPASIIVEGGGVLCDPDADSTPEVVEIFCLVPAELGSAPFTVDATFADARGSTTRTWTIQPAPEPVNPPRVAIAGDSYISGEGGHNYIAGTDVADNKCHRSEVSWAFRTALDLTGGDRSRIGFFACSGSTTREFAVDGKSGEDPQVKQLREFGPDIVLLSLGGNDVPFFGLVLSCLVMPLCHEWPGWESSRLWAAEDAADRVEAVLKQIRTDSPDAEVHLIGYPSAVSPESTVACPGLGVPPDPRDIFGIGSARIDMFEVGWTRDTFVSHLNNELRDAAATEDANFIDPIDWFDGHGICSTQTEWAHGITAGDDICILLCVIGRESFHPNPDGYAEMYRRVSDMDLFGHATPKAASPSAAGVSASTADPPTATFALDHPDTAPVPWGGTGSFRLRGGSPSTDVTLALSSWVPTVLGAGTTDELGILDLDFTLPDGLYPGLHSIAAFESNSGVWLGDVVFRVVGGERCVVVTGDDDADEDGVADRCDVSVVDGQAGDADLDGHLNRDDNCPTVGNADQLDANGNDVGDVCDPAENFNFVQGVQPALTSLTEPEVGLDGVDDCARTVTISNLGDRAVLATFSADPDSGTVIRSQSIGTLTITDESPDWRIVVGNIDETEFTGTFDCQPTEPERCSPPAGRISSRIFAIGERLGPWGSALRDVAIRLCLRGL